MNHKRLFKTLLIITTLSFTLISTTLVFAGEINKNKRYQADLESIRKSREGMRAIIEFIDAHPEIFPQSKADENKPTLNRDQRMIAWTTWQAFLDHVIYFDSMGRIYGDIYANAEGRKNQAEPFFAAFASFLAQYRFALDFIERIEMNPDMHVMLNEPVPELGLQEGTYATLKFRFLNVLRGAEFARLNVLYPYYLLAEENPLRDITKEDIEVIWDAGKGTGPTLTAQNALKIVSDAGFTTWFPVQKRISEAMGNVKVMRQDITLISKTQIKNLIKQLQPGDILLQRREWYGSNIGIPGFWTHAALYIGTPEERTSFFDTQAMKNRLKEKGSADENLESLLKQTYPAQYSLSVKQQEGHPVRVLEAIGEGVSFTTLEHSAAADSMVVLRPNLPKQDIAQAILRAFNYSGRPYDFNFDFRTDSELVCSELIYKAYEPTEESDGLMLPLTEVMGRPLISPNEIARLFDEEYEKEKQQLAFVAFLDGSEKELKAVSSTAESFRKSWKRPKWHILIHSPEDGTAQ